MRTVPSSLLTMLQGRRLFRATLIQVDFARTTKSGATRLGFTNHDQALSINFSGGTLSFSPRYIVGETSYNAKLNTSIDDTELTLKIDDSVINWFDIRTRAWHEAVVRVGYCNWKDLTQGSYIQAVYKVANATAEEGKLKLELRGLERNLEVNVSKRLTVNCQHTFGNDRCGYNLTPNAWAATTLYATSQPKDWKAKVVVRPTVQNGYWYEATTGGTSGGSEPTWPTTVGNTVVDGTVTWTCIRAGRLTGTVASVSDKRSFVATGINSVSDWFASGRVLWLTGDNATLRMKVRSDDGAGGIAMEEDCYEDISVGDTFTIDAGCRKRISQDCTTKFDNTWNAWAFPHLVQENALAKAPKG